MKLFYLNTISWMLLDYLFWVLQNGFVHFCQTETDTDYLDAAALMLLIIIMMIAMTTTMINASSLYFVSTTTKYRRLGCASHVSVAVSVREVQRDGAARHRQVNASTFI